MGGSSHKKGDIKKTIKKKRKNLRGKTGLPGPEGGPRQGHGKSMTIRHKQP